jgi:hypothetical protein
LENFTCLEVEKNNWNQIKNRLKRKLCCSLHNLAGKKVKKGYVVASIKKNNNRLQWDGKFSNIVKQFVKFKQSNRIKMEFQKKKMVDKDTGETKYKTLKSDKEIF